ncbi:MAG: flagellar motor switch protein FliN [Planctomycetota bacterium]|jgi:flagellar motor switch protein FliN/FliY
MGEKELSQEEIDALLSRAAERARKATEGAPAESLRPPTAAPDPADVHPQAFEELLDIPLEVRVRLGETEMTLEEIVALGEGVAIPLDRAPGDPVDVLVNDRLFARGEVAVVEDRFTVRITEVLAPEEQGERKGSGE